MTAPFDLSRPTVRLKPKANARAIRRGFPWAYANELVTDRRTRALAPGTLAVLEDDARQPIGLFAINPNSKIMARLIDRDVQATIDLSWFTAKLERALALRKRLYDAPFYRLVHAEADGLPGVVIDRFGDTCVLQPNAAWAERHLDTMTQAVVAVTGATTVLKNSGGRTRSLEGLDSENATLHGHPPEAPLTVPMNDATYFADVTGGQKTGLFFDQRPNHAFAAQLAGPGTRVLDVFSHVGGFALAALAAGAEQAIVVDGSASALELAHAGAAAMNAEGRLEVRQGDAFDVLSAMASAEDRYDLVICDPPAFAPSKPALDAGLRAYERVARLAASLVRQDGYLVLCSCSHAADLNRFRGACLRGIGRAGRHAQLVHTGAAGPDHPLLPQLAESGYLKALFFRL